MKRKIKIRETQQGLIKKELNKMLVKEDTGNNSAFNAINKFMYFGSNYPSNWMEQVWDNNTLAHLKPKFNSAYETIGTYGFYKFYFDLDDSNKRRLIDWINANYDG